MTGATRPLRFCMVTTFYPPYSFGGDGVFVQRLSQELARQGHSVDVVHNIDAYRLLAKGEPTGSYDEHPGVRVHGLRSRVGMWSALAMHQTGTPGFASRRLRALLEQDYDVIHYHNVSLMGAPEVLKYGRAIKLYTMHEYWLVCPTHVLLKFGRELCAKPQCLRCTLAHGRPPQLWRYAERLAEAARHVDAFLALQSFSMEVHRERGFQFPMRLLPPFVSRPDAPAQSSAPPAERYYLYAGRLERIKGVHELLDAFQGPESRRLWIAGEGSERAALEKQAAGNPRIRFLGHVREPQLSALYRNAIALIVPSLTYEVFPLVLLEAFRQGTPAVVRRIGGMPEIVESAGAGWAYSSSEELRKGLQELEEQPELRAAMSRRAVAGFEQHWTPEAHLRKYFEIIQAIERKGE